MPDRRVYAINGYTHWQDVSASQPGRAHRLGLLRNFLQLKLPLVWEPWVHVATLVCSVATHVAEQIIKIFWSGLGMLTAPNSMFALHLRPLGLAGHRADTVVATEVRIRRMNDERLARVRRHHRLRVVDEHGVGDTAEMLKGLFMARDSLAQALPRKRDRKAAAGKAERHDEELHDLADVGDPHARLAEIDLGLGAGRRLAPHRRRPGRRGLAERDHRPSHDDHRA